MLIFVILPQIAHMYLKGSTLGVWGTGGFNLEPIGPCIAGVRSASIFLARSQWTLGLCLGCALSLILFVNFMDRISRSLQYGYLRIVSFVELVAE